MSFGFDFSTKTCEICGNQAYSGLFCKNCGNNLCTVHGLNENGLPANESERDEGVLCPVCYAAA